MSWSKRVRPWLGLAGALILALEGSCMSLPAPAPTGARGSQGTTPHLGRERPSHVDATQNDAVGALSAWAADPAMPRFDPASIVPVLDDPRLADVKALADREAYKGAAEALRTKLAGGDVGAGDDASWHYQLGRLYGMAGDPAAAVRAFDRAAVSDWVLADYARFMAADLLVAMDQPGEALSRLGLVGSTALGDEHALLVARAHADRREVDRAAPIWRIVVARSPRPKGWQEVALAFARALLNEPTSAHAEEAVVVARMVIDESPAGRGVGEARELEARALSTIPSARREVVSGSSLVVRAERALSLGESRQGREAIAVAEQVIAELEKGGAAEQPSETSCKAYLAWCKGLAVVKRYSEASDACGSAADRCQGQPLHATALFLAGRHALHGGQLAAARRRFADLEQRFPGHALADDARLHGAEAALSLGDAASFTSMLGRIDEDYPAGDMVEQALFSLALSRIEQGDWGGALSPLERAARREPGRTPPWAAGRAHYFLARARFELGQDAVASLVVVIRRFPLSYYMVHAYSRLAEIDRTLAARALAEASEAEPDGSFVIPHHPELERPAFLRAAELVRQGDARHALAELDLLGVKRDDAHPALRWASAFLLARIDAVSESHGVLRSGGVWHQHQPHGIWRPLWELAFPRPHRDVVLRELGRSPIPEHLAYAVMREESAFEPRAVSHSGAYGLMQLIVPTAQIVARPLGLSSSADALKQPAVNVALGCRYLSQLAKKFEDNALLCIPGYNAGPGAPARWLAERPAEDFDVWVERIPYDETRAYTKRVISSMAAYAVLYGEGMDAPMLRMPKALHHPELAGD